MEQGVKLLSEYEAQRITFMSPRCQLNHTDFMRLYFSIQGGMAVSV